MLRKFVIKTVKSMQAKTTHRIRIVKVNAPAATDTYVTLLTAKDDPNYDLVTDGTNVAECEIGSFIRKVQLHITYQASAAGDMVEMMLFKDPDAAFTTNMTPTQLYTSDVSSISLDVRKNTVWYHLFVASTGRDTFVGGPSLKAMGRIKVMRENDNLRLLFSVPANDSGTYYITGRIITAK